MVIELKCDSAGDLTLIGPNGKIWFYERKDWYKCNAHFQSLVRPPTGDPK